MPTIIFLCKSQAYMLADQVDNICGDIVADYFSTRVDLCSIEVRQSGDCCERLKSYFKKLFGESWV